MMRILALDLATRTSWALNDPELSGVEDFSVRRGESPGMRYLRFVAWLEEMIAKARPDVVFYEQAHQPRHTATIKKHATGRGNAGKPEMITAYRAKWGCSPADDNEADARWLLDLAMKEFGRGEHDHVGC